MESACGPSNSRFFFGLFFSLSVTCFAIATTQHGQCVMYGQCGEGDFGTLNCLFSGPAKVIDDSESIELLKDICPEYVRDEKALTCCDANQIAQLDANFKLPQRLLSRCPSCFANFRKNFCKLTCSPRQSDYIRVTKTQKNEEGKDMINELVYFVSQSYVDGLFESCRQVEGIIPGTRVIDLMCGKQGPKCTGPDWLEFMGSTPDNSGFSPVQINYNITDEGQLQVEGKTYFPMNESTFRCSEAVSEGQGACGCSDCSSSCTTPKPETTTVAAQTTLPSKASTNQKQDEESSSSSEGQGSPKDEESSRFRILDQKLFRRILSPLIVIAPAFAEN